MDKTVPAPAATLLNFIGAVEAPAGYDTLYGNAQKRYSWRLTDLPVGDVLAKGPTWSSAHGSSACGRYQFMAGRNHTLSTIVKELRVRPDQTFDENLQDRLGHYLLVKRGYDRFVAGRLSRTAFGKALAQEWASMPVLAACQGQKRWVLRGQSYYAGDGLNKSLVKPERLEVILITALAQAQHRPPEEALKAEAKTSGSKAVAQGTGAAASGTAAGNAATTVDVATFDWTAWLFAGGVGLALVALVVLFVYLTVVNTKRASAFNKEARRK